MARYVKVNDQEVLLEMTGDEWAVTLDALEKARADPPQDYTPWNLSALTRTINKLLVAAVQLREDLPSPRNPGN